MALTTFQREILAVISRSRLHDSREALSATWMSDRLRLADAGISVEPVREAPAFVEAVAAKEGSRTLIQWTVDSAYRFFPLVRDEVLGLTLHPFDLATNKVLALVGRLETRDWIDVIGCHGRIQNLGYLAWAACGKDPGLNPQWIVSEAARSGRYSREEVEALEFAGQPPDAADLSRLWRAMLAQAAEIIALLPATHVGTCVLGPDLDLFRGEPRRLAESLDKAEIRFHEGRLRGAFPSFPGS